MKYEDIISRGKSSNYATEVTNVEKGTDKKGWQEIDNKWYYFDDNGVMQTGWCKTNGNWHYLAQDGIMVTGWDKIDGKWYYFDENGVMKTGWYQTNGNWHYSEPSGEMVTGWKEIDNKWYHFDENGVMQTGWYETNGNWHYSEASGVMVTGWKEIDGKIYHFDENGVKNINCIIDGWKIDSNGVATKSSKIKAGVEYVNVRENAGTTYKILGTLRGSTEITILNKVKSGSDSYYWYEIYFNGQIGYVREDFVVPVEINITNNNVTNVNGVAGDKPSAGLIYSIKASEGFAPSRYPDIGGTITDGYGLIKDEIKNFPDVITEEFATEKLVEHVCNAYYTPVLKAIRNAGVLNPLQREVDAFTDFAYNEGVDAFKTSTLLKKYAAGERGQEIYNELLRWVYFTGANGKLVFSQGLKNRRIKEWDIFSGANVQIEGYNSKPTISIINREGQVTNKVVTANNGYGANPYN